jgi:hypothetical protein
MRCWAVSLIAIICFAVTSPVSATAQVISGGLGLTAEQFGARYGAPQEDIMGSAYTVANGSIVAYDKLGDPIKIVERTFNTSVSYDDAVLTSASLMPSDAVYVGQYVSESDLIVDTYTSEWLMGQFPDPEDWTNADPGTFIVIYGAYNPALGNEQVTRMVLAIGNNP